MDLTATNNQRFSRVFWTILLIVAIAFVLMRFINIDADPPNKVRPGRSFNDEGRWAVNSLAQVQHGNWYIDGGYNPSIVVPVIPALQVLCFKIFGVSFYAVRYLTVSFFILGAVATYYLIRTIENHEAGCIALFFLSTNLLCFTFSRVGYLDIPMISLVMCCLAAICLATKIGLVIACIISSLFFVLAVLTKTTALASLPAIVLLILLDPGTIKKKLLGTGVFLLISIGLLCTYYILIYWQYPEDVEFFNYLTMPKHGAYNLEKILNSLFNVTNPVFLILSATVLVLAVAQFRKFYLYRLIYVGGVLAGSFLFASLIKNYNPPRYQIPLIFGMAVILSPAIKKMIGNRYEGMGNLICVIMFFVSVAWSGLEIYQYTTHPKYVFMNMSHAIERKIKDSGADNPLLLGECLQSRVALAINVKSAAIRPRQFHYYNTQHGDNLEITEEQHRMNKAIKEQLVSPLVGDRKKLFVIHSRPPQWEKHQMWLDDFVLTDVVEYELPDNSRQPPTTAFFCTLERKP